MGKQHSNNIIPVIPSIICIVEFLKDNILVVSDEFVDFYENQFHEIFFNRMKYIYCYFILCVCVS